MAHHTASADRVDTAALAHRLEDYTRLVGHEMRAATETRHQLDGLYGMIHYHMGWRAADLSEIPAGSSGKGLRATFCLLAAEACGGSIDDALAVAAAIDLFHNFSLIHDDIEDNSPARRHRATVWTIWGIAQAINLGDSLFALAQRTLFRSPLAAHNPALFLEIVHAAQETMISLAEGQYLDMEFETRLTVSSADYLAMIARKSAALIAYAGWAGAACADAPEATRMALHRFGYELGLAFQIRDDVLGIWGDEALTGKSGTSDILTRKKTLPIVLAVETAIPVDQELLRSIYSASSVDAAGLTTVLDVLERANIRAQVEDAVRQHDTAAQAALSEAHLPSEQRALLSAFSSLLVKRVS